MDCVPARKLITHKIRWAVFKQEFISFLVLPLEAGAWGSFVLRSKAVNLPLLTVWASGPIFLKYVWSKYWKNCTISLHLRHLPHMGTLNWSSTGFLPTPWPQEGTGEVEGADFRVGCCRISDPRVSALSGWGAWRPRLSTWRCSQAVALLLGCPPPTGNQFTALQISASGLLFMESCCGGKMKIENNDKCSYRPFFNIINICFFEMSWVVLLLTSSVIGLQGNSFPLTLFKVFKALK